MSISFIFAFSQFKAYIFNITLDNKQSKLKFVHICFHFFTNAFTDDC